MHMNNNNQLIPRLRFPEFDNSGDWEKCKISKAITPISREFEKPKLNYLALGIRSHGKGTFLKPEQDPEKNAMDRLYVVHKDDLIVNITFAWEGAIAIAEGQDHGAYVSHRFPTYTFNQKISSPNFFRYIINKKSFFHTLGLISPGGAGRNRVMSKKDFLEINVLFPKLEEQQKIADCLSSVDELIDAEGRKLAILKSHKKGLMQQLFPTKNQTIPTLRFSEFENSPEWEQIQLGSICELYQPLTLSASQLNLKGPYDVYGANGIIGKHDSFNHEFSEVIVTCRGATCGEVHRTNPKSWITGNAMVVKPKSNSITSNYLFQYFKKDGLKSVVSGSAQPQITRAGFSPFLIWLPNGEEQRKIADFLSSIDNLIAAQDEKITALKNHKKGLMQQLFPSIEEA